MINGIQFPLKKNNNNNNNFKNFKKQHLYPVFSRCTSEFVYDEDSCHKNLLATYIHTDGYSFSINNHTFKVILCFNIIFNVINLEN